MGSAGAAQEGEGGAAGTSLSFLADVGFFFMGWFSRL
jgi:hypothetical protein